MNEELIEVYEDLIEEEGGEEENIKYNVVYYWKNNNHFDTFDKIDMRLRKTRLKTIKIEKHNICKNTNSVIKGGFKSCIIT